MTVFLILMRLTSLKRIYAELTAYSSYIDRFAFCYSPNGHCPAAETAKSFRPKDPQSNKKKNLY